MILAQVHLEGLRAPDAWGLHAEVQGLVALLRYGGVETSFEALMGITGSAFRTHCLRIADNPGMPLGPVEGQPDAEWAPRYAWTNLRFNNYGVLESARFFYGGELREVEGLDVLELWQLLRLELDAGRPMLAYGAFEPERADLLVGYRLEKDPLRQVLLLQRRDGLVEIELPSPMLRSGSGDPLPWGFCARTGRPAMPMRHALLFRSGPREPWRGSDLERALDVLRWAVAHAHNRKELVYESRRFYATGLRALREWAAFLRDDVALELAHPTTEAPEPLTDLALHVAVTALEWARARRAGAVWLRALHASLPSSPDPFPGEPDALLRAADAYDAAADELDAVRAVLGDAWDEPAITRAALTSDVLRRHAAALVLRAHDHDARAIEALSAALNPSSPPPA